ncbi:MAG TPA: S9 family peptidase, partial [Verrucomicrobiae bacterium]|nr:S9 family peptidase [Verrucomicrobiae bacterium]
MATILAAASQTPTAAKHPLTFKDMMALKRIGSPSLSPDGKWVLFTAMDVNLDENKRTNHIWVVPIGGGDARPLTSDPAGESGPRWSPDGKKFVFVSGKGGSQQVWVAEFNPSTGDINGNPTQITHISTEADGAIWSPDGKNIVFT